MAADTTKPAAQLAEPMTRKPSNLRTALVLGLIAAVFFGGVVVNRLLLG